MAKRSKPLNGKKVLQSHSLLGLKFKDFLGLRAPFVSTSSPRHPESQAPLSYAPCVGCGGTQLRDSRELTAAIRTLGRQGSALCVEACRTCRMLAKGYVVEFGLLLSAPREGQWQAALHLLLDEPSRCGVPVSIISATAAIAACEQVGGGLLAKRGGKSRIRRTHRTRRHRLAGAR